MVFEESLALGLEGGDDDGGVEVFADVAGGDAYIPAEGGPFSAFVIGQGTGRHRVDGLPLVASFDEKFEDMGFARASRGLDNYIVPTSQGSEGGLLPEVGEDEPLSSHVGFTAKHARS